MKSKASDNPKLGPEIKSFLLESNYIEEEYSIQAFRDAKKAWKFMVDKDFTINNLLDCHKILMTNLRPDIAGRFRNCDVWIGGERKKFIHESKFREELEKIFGVMSLPNTVIITTKENHAKCAKRSHINFEKIHPFEDGNGRVGRILYNVHRQRLGLPIHIIHEGDEQYEYYKWFNDPIKNI